MVATGWWSRAHGWRERESSFFQRERAFKGERERNSRGRSIQEREEKLREEVKSVSWVFNLGFLTPPNGCLDQLGPMLALGAALLLHPTNKSTSWSVTLPEFYILLQSILLNVISITRIWCIWQEIHQKKWLKLYLWHSYIPNMTLTLKAYAIQY